jgi:electron transfer flavoprotein beta subunit
VDVGNNTITVKREIEGGSELIEGTLPALLTVELGLGIPRYASLPELARALRQDIEVWGAGEIGALPERLGLRGSPTSVHRIFGPPVREGGLVFDSTENTERAIEDFVEAFFEKESPLLEHLLSPDKG